MISPHSSKNAAAAMLIGLSGSIRSYNIARIPSPTSGATGKKLHGDLLQQQHKHDKDDSEKSIYRFDTPNSQSVTANVTQTTL